MLTSRDCPENWHWPRYEPESLPHCSGPRRWHCEGQWCLRHWAGWGRSSIEKHFTECIYYCMTHNVHFTAPLNKGILYDILAETVLLSRTDAQMREQYKYITLPVKKKVLHKVRCIYICTGLHTHTHTPLVQLAAQSPVHQPTLHPVPGRAGWVELASQNPYVLG